nr:hypothetical protein StreXyl84_73940 [Streptomyces sp. Xyl84]
MSPVPMDAGKKSSDETYSSIHSELTTAKSTLDGVHQAVDGLRAQLSSGYGGEDGQAYLQVINRWLGEFEQINAATQKIITVVEHSSATDRRALESNIDETNIAGRTSAIDGSDYSTHSFHTLAPEHA